MEVEVLFVAFSSFYPFWCFQLPSAWMEEGLKQVIAGTEFLQKLHYGKIQCYLNVYDSDYILKVHGH